MAGTGRVRRPGLFGPKRGIGLTWTNLTVSFLVSFLVSLAVTPLVRGMAARWKIVEKPNGRANGEIAHIGGVAIVSAIMIGLVPVFLFFVTMDPLTKILITILIVSGFTIFMLGVIDDLRSLHYKYKLILQIGVALFIGLGGLALLTRFSILSLSPPFLLVALLGVVSWILAVTTSFNLIDGIDGLAAGISIVSSVAFAVAGYLLDQPLVLFLSVVVMGSAVAFLKYNFPPAKIFMGDSGSLFFGLMFGIISLLTLARGEDIFLRVAGSVLILTVPLLDTVLALVRRMIRGRPLFEADLSHLHHVILVRVRSMRKVDYILWSVSALFAILGILTIMGNMPAFYSGVILQAVVFARAIVAMTRSSFQRDIVDKIINEYRVAKIPAAGGDK